MERHTFIKLTRIRNAIRHSNLSKEQIDLILDETVNKLIQPFSEQGEAARIEEILKESNPFWTWDRVKQYVTIITTILLYLDIGNASLITTVALSPILIELVKVMIKKPFSYDTYLKLTSTIMAILGKSKVFGIPMLKIKKEGRRSRRKNKGLN
jgi:hypothetical protein